VLILDLAFAFYLGAFIWLDIVWEVLLGIVIFAYLLATMQQRWAKNTGLGHISPIRFCGCDPVGQLSDRWDSVIQMQGEYVLTDPSLYVPLIMMVILVFYFICSNGYGKQQEEFPMMEAEAYDKMMCPWILKLFRVYRLK